MIRKGRREESCKRGPKPISLEACHLDTGEVLKTFANYGMAQKAGYSPNGIRAAIRGRYSMHRGMTWRIAGALQAPIPSGKIEALIQALGLRNANLIAAG